jgi:hypothetical protein
MLGQFVGTPFDGCTSCQDALLTLMVEDPTTTTRLVELACVSTHAALGGLPANMTDEQAPGLATREFRRLARAGADGATHAMFTNCERMTSGSKGRRRSIGRRPGQRLAEHQAFCPAAYRRPALSPSVRSFPWPARRGC